MTIKANINYTVLNRHGEVEASGVDLIEAARTLLYYDGHTYDINKEAEGYQLWTSLFSRNSITYDGLKPSVIFSLESDPVKAEEEIFETVIAHAAWFCGCTVMTDDEYEALA